MRAVKRKVKLLQVFKNQDGYNELALHLYFEIVLYCNFCPLPTGFVYYVLQNLQRESFSEVDVLR